MMNSGPSTSGRSKLNRDRAGRRGAAASAIALIELAPWADGTPTAPVERAQLSSPNRKFVPFTGADARQRNVGRQLRRDFALRLEALQRAVQDTVRSEILHAIDPEGQLGESGSVEHLPRQEMLRPKAQESTSMLDQVHGRGPQKTRDKIVGGVVVNLAWSSELSELAMGAHRDAITHGHCPDLAARDT